MFVYWHLSQYSWLEDQDSEFRKRAINHSLMTRQLILDPKNITQQLVNKTYGFTSLPSNQVSSLLEETDKYSPKIKIISLVDLCTTVFCCFKYHIWQAYATWLLRFTMARERESLFNSVIKSNIHYRSRSQSTGKQIYLEGRLLWV